MNAPDRDPPGLPNANEFSPGQVQLRRVLDLAAAHAGNRPALVEALRLEYFGTAASRRRAPADQLQQQRTRANNVLIGMSQYGLFDLTTSRLTRRGEELRAIPDDASLHEAFAKHILRACNGLTVLEAVRAMQNRGDAITKLSLASHLRSVYGFSLPTGTTRHQILLNWLSTARVVDRQKGYTVDEAKLQALIGLQMGTLEELRGLNREQLAFLRTIRRQAEIHGTQPVLAKNLYRLAIEEHGQVLREDQLRRNVYAPLETAGWIQLHQRSEGRGGASGLIAATPKLVGISLEDLTGEPTWGIPADLRPHLNTPLDKLAHDLQSEDKNIKGRALELIAIRLAVTLNLTPIRLRVRGVETGGAEVDLVAEGAHLHFSRWLFQCKNTPGSSVALSDLAKEVGMAVLLRAHVIVLVTTGTFAQSVSVHAKALAETSYLQAVLVDKTALEPFFKKDAPALLDHFHATAAATMRLKKKQISQDGPPDQPLDTSSPPS